MSQSTIEPRVWRLMNKGVRRLHVASGDVWRLTGFPKITHVEVTRERDGFARSITSDDWLDRSKWGVPKTRPAARPLP